jgi:DNA uptake protein ComE-like DNA-binding protein
MQVLDINTAPIEELSLLRGIGKVTARQIIANRPYDEPYDLVMRGVLGEMSYEKNAAHLVVDRTSIKR